MPYYSSGQALTVVYRIVSGPFSTSLHLIHLFLHSPALDFFLRKFFLSNEGLIELHCTFSPQGPDNPINVIDFFWAIILHIRFSIFPFPCTDSILRRILLFQPASVSFLS